MTPLRIVVVGTGAVGGYFGARLARAGHDVQFLARSDQEHLARHGLRVESVAGDFSLTRVEAHADPAAVRPAELALVALKTTANAALAAILPRVLAPGGRLLFSEHGRAPDENVRKWQGRIQPFWSPLAGGCKLDRDIPAILKEAGFDPQVQSMYIPGPRIVSYHYWGEAIAV